jgi:hypothetical protein
MPITLDKFPLSGSTNGRAIKIAATGSPGTLIHTAQSGTSGHSELWLYAFNSNTLGCTLTMEWGGTSSDDRTTITLPPGETDVIISPGFILNNGLAVHIYAATANVVFVKGWEVRKTVS